jgi:iron complex outermembrane receptor protein
VGVKYQPAGGKSLFTAALFDLTKTNVETYDADVDDYFQTGEIRSKGLELEAKTQVAKGLDLFAAYTYNDVEVTKSSDVDLGKTPIQVPRQLASVGVDYALGGALPGFSVGGGVRYVGKRYDDAANTKSTPSFTLVDAAVRYEHGPWRFALNVANLFDKEYVASHAYGGYYPGAERTFTLTAKYRF